MQLQATTSTHQEQSASLPSPSTIPRTRVDNLSRPSTSTSSERLITRRRARKEQAALWRILAQ